MVATVLATEPVFVEPLRPFIRRAVNSFDSVPMERRQRLEAIAGSIRSSLDAETPSRLTFICTHNSRRSHLAQIWCQVATTYYRVRNVETFSGGTAATACNVRTVRALRRAGLSVVRSTEGDNPVYLAQYAESAAPVSAYSKVYDDAPNPDSGFAAVMCCSDADERCPVVQGARERFSLHYEDPKAADGTPSEVKRYDERCFQVAVEMFYLMSKVERRDTSE